jgi:hypothetical protein
MEATHFIYFIYLLLTNIGCPPSTLPSSPFHLKFWVSTFLVSPSRPWVSTLHASRFPSQASPSFPSTFPPRHAFLLGNGMPCLIVSRRGWWMDRQNLSPPWGKGGENLTPLVEERAWKFTLFCQRLHRDGCPRCGYSQGGWEAR